MPVIDKALFEKLKSWWDGNRPKNQQIIYVNRHDRILTDATIRRLMFEIKGKDFMAEEYISLYSAENFYKNMREYASDVAKLCLKEPAADDSAMDIIKSILSPCGWITLIIENMESMSNDEERMNELFELLLILAEKKANIILIGNEGYKKVFAGCEHALKKMDSEMAAQMEDAALMICCYEQEETPQRFAVVNDGDEKHRDELDFYWKILYEQLNKGYFDYHIFKNLLKETLEYLIPRMTKEYLYRKDVLLVEKIGDFNSTEEKTVEGCEPWEVDASRIIAVALHSAIVNRYENNDDILSGDIELDVIIKHAARDYGGVQSRGYSYETISVSVDTICQAIDQLAEEIRYRINNLD